MQRPDQDKDVGLASHELADHSDPFREPISEQYELPPLSTSAATERSYNLATGQGTFGDGGEGNELRDGTWITNDEVTALGQLPVLDALRGLALMGPVLDHIIPRKPLNIMIGSMGVAVFFVLSGFLITGVLRKLLSDYDPSLRGGHPLKVDWVRYLGRFYMDRFVRLFPALLLVVVYVSVEDIIRDSSRTPEVMQNAARALLSIANTPALTPALRNPLPHMWSLACEEQYYLLWSLTLPFLARLRLPLRLAVLLSLIGASIGARSYAGILDKKAHWLLTWNRSLVSAALYKMLLGSSLRLVPIPRRLAQPVTAWTGLFLILACPIAALAVPAHMEKHHWFSLGFDMSVSVGTALVIIGTLYDPPRLFLAKVPRLVGRISYAGYLWTVAVIYEDEAMFKGYRALADSALGFWIAVASTLYVEEPLRRYWRRVRDGGEGARG